jgi:uncharacterized radical SAM superfamily Fe-S cluster-containing enzyme
MKLKDWLDMKGVAPPDFARHIGRTREAVRRYIAGERIPDKGTMLAISEQTSGKVTANDFFELEATVAVCSVCGRTGADPSVLTCIEADCALRPPRQAQAA